MKCVVVGASAGLGRVLSTRLAARGDDVYLIASDEKDLSALSADLTLQYDVSVDFKSVNLVSVDATSLKEEVISNFGAVDALFYIAGYGDDKDCGPISEDLAERLMHVNFNAAVKIVNAFLDHLSARPDTNIVAIGSVAEIRGRSKNVIYGAAKRGLEFYFSALRNRLADTGCRVQYYRLGFMKTSMLTRYSPGLPTIMPEDAARTICQNLGHDMVGRYLPRWWIVIAIILKSLPWAIFHRLKI